MMSPVAIVTLVGAGLLVVALALYLIVIAALLWRIQTTLGLVLSRVQSIAQRADPINGLVARINADLAAVDEALGDQVSSQREAAS